MPSCVGIGVRPECTWIPAKCGEWKLEKMVEPISPLHMMEGCVGAWARIPAFASPLFPPWALRRLPR